MTGPAGLSLNVDDAACRRLLDGRSCNEQPNSQPVDTSNPQLAAPGTQGAPAIAGGLATTPGTTGGLPLPDVLANPPVIPPPPVRDGSQVPAAPAETPTEPETQPSADAQGEGEDPTSVTDGGEPHVSAEAEVEGGQASPPDPSKIESISDFRIFLRSLGIDDQKLTDEMLKDGALTHDELEEADPNHERYLTDAAFNLVSRGGLGINVFGGVASDEDGITFADGERFMEKVIEPLVTGTKSREEVITRFMHASRFRVIPRHALSRTFRERTHSKEGLWETNNGVSTLSAKTFLDKYIRPELRDLAGQVLANILGHAVTDADRLNEEQLDTFMLTIYYLARIDEPREVMEGAKAIADLTDQLEGSTPETFITWLTKGAENPVQAESANPAEQSQQNPQDNMPAELKEGMKLLFVYENGQFVTGGAENNQYQPRPSITDAEYREAIGHFESVLADSSVSLVYRQRALAYLMQCYTELTGRASSFEAARDYVLAAVAAIDTESTREIFGDAMVIGQLFSLAEMIMQPNILFRDTTPNDPGRQLLGEEFVYQNITTRIESRIAASTTLSNDERNDLSAQLARTLAGMYTGEYRRHAVVVAQAIRGTIPRGRPQVGPDGQVVRNAQGEVQVVSVTAEEFIEEIKQKTNDHPLLLEARMQFSMALQGEPNTVPRALRETAAAAFQRAIDVVGGIGDIWTRDNDPADLAEARIGRAQCLAYAAMPTAVTGAEPTPQDLIGQGRALLAVLLETTGIDSAENHFTRAAGAGLLSTAIESLNELIAQTTDPELKTELKKIRDEAIRALVMMAQTLIFAARERGADAQLRRDCRAAYQAIADLLTSLGLESESLLPGQEGGESIPLGGRDGLIRSIDRGFVNTAITSNNQAIRARQVLSTTPPAEGERGTRGGGGETSQSDSYGTL
jgi:hypothetical protein